MDKRKSAFSRLFTGEKIITIEDARREVSEVVNTYYCVAGLQALVGYFILGPSIFLDAGCYFIFATLLKKTNKPWAAGLLIGLSAVSMMTTLQARFVGSPGGRNIFLAAIALAAGIRGYKAARYIKNNPPNRPLSEMNTQNRLAG